VSGGGTGNSGGYNTVIPYEIVSYGSVTLTAANKYNLTPTILRGQMGTVPADHPAGSTPSVFVDLSSEVSIFKTTIPSGAIVGNTLHFKFPTFNQYNSGLQDLASCTDYTYVVTGETNPGPDSSYTITPAIVLYQGKVGGWPGVGTGSTGWTNPNDVYWPSFTVNYPTGAVTYAENDTGLTAFSGSGQTRYVTIFDPGHTGSGTAAADSTNTHATTPGYVFLGSITSASSGASGGTGGSSGSGGPQSSGAFSFSVDGTPVSPVNLSDTTPAAPGGDTNVKWQKDANGNVSGYVSTGGGSSPSGSFHGFEGPVGITGGTAFTTVAGSPNTYGINITFGWQWGGILGGTVNVGQNTFTSSLPPYWTMTASSGSCYLGEYTGQTAFSIGNLAQWQTYLALGQTGTGRCWMGFCPAQAGTLVTANPNTSIVAFRFDSAVDTNWQAYTGTAAATFTLVDTGVVADTNFHQFKIINSEGNMEFFVDGNLVATILSSATGFPSSTTGMSDFIQIDVASGSVTARVNSMQWWSQY